MDRQTWLAGRRAAVEAEYDAEAATFDDHPYPNEAQVEWVDRLLASCPRGGLVLDAPCGTGRYFPQVTAAGLRVVGVDGSAGMLAVARDRHLAEELHHGVLQEIEFTDRFDAVMTVDAMENVPPEDWPVVAANVRRALRAGGRWYLTVEEQDRAAVERVYQREVASGLPVVAGEVVEGDVAGYHYYPERDQVLGWFEASHLRVVDEGYTQYDGWGYRHFLVA